MPAVSWLGVENVENWAHFSARVAWEMEGKCKIFASFRFWASAPERSIPRWLGGEKNAEKSAKVLARVAWKKKKNAGFFNTLSLAAASQAGSTSYVVVLHKTNVSLKEKND